MKKRVLGALLCLSMVVGMTTTSVVSADTKVEDSEIVTEGDGKSWTWDLSPVELSVFVDQSAYVNDWDTERYEYFKKVEEETGIHFTFTSGDENKLNAIIASGNLPDVIVMWTGYSQRGMLENEDKLYAIDDLISEYAPTFDTLPESMMDWYRNDKTGKTYAMVNYFYANEWLTDEYKETIHNRITAREDLMEEIGVTPEDFSTKEGFKASLQKFKDSGIAYNGLEVAPFMLGAAIPSQSVEFWAQNFGACAETENGDWQDIRMTDEMKESLLYLNDLYRSGLMDIECLTIDNQQLRQKVGSGATFVTTGYAGSSSPATAALMGADPDAKIVPVGPITGDNGKTLQSPAGGQGWLSVLITKDCERPDRAIRFMEYLYDEHNMLEANYGMEGLVWNMGEDGKIEYTEQYLKDKEADPSNVSTTYGFGSNALYFSIQPQLLNKYLPAPTDPIEIANKEIDKFYYDYGFYGLPFSELESTLDSDTAAVAAKLNDVWNQSIGMIITAASEEEAGAAYDAAITTMKNEGWDQYYEAINTTFKERKEKLGIEMAHPYNQ